MPGKLKIVVSDFHLGAGPPDIGVNPLEDFVADEAFARFLETVRAESNREGKEVELIINGDFFEFLQVPAVSEFDPQRMYPAELYYDSSQPASIQRLNLIVAGHPMVFDALADFIQVEKPRRRMTLIKGNHDVNLFWPGVKQRLREILGATGRRASMLLFAERYVSREHIYVEHGHQYAESLNRWSNFDDPRDGKNPDQLFYPPGSQFVIEFFNAIERDRAWADSLKPLTALAWYSLEWDFLFAARMLLTLARHIPPPGFHSEEGSSRALEALCRRLENPAICREWADCYRVALDFRRDFHTRIGQLLVPAASPPGMFVWPTPPTDESAIEIARAEIAEIQASMRRVAARVADAEGARVIVFGHTHRPGLETLEDGATLINCGSWQWLGGYDATEFDAWRDLFTRPERLRPHHRLTYVRIDYDEQNMPQAQLRDFVWPEQEEPAPGRSELGHILNRLRRRLGGAAQG